MFHKILTLPLLIAFSISATISFDIDMSDYQFPNNDYNSVVINGSWNNWSGWGVTLNDVIWHVGQENLPFGGIGPSGMGSYHGEEGFKEFSHAKSIYKQPNLDLMKLAGFVPPYKKKAEKTSSTS